MTAAHQNDAFQSPEISSQNFPADRTRKPSALVEHTSDNRTYETFSKSSGTEKWRIALGSLDRQDCRQSNSGWL